MLQLLCSALTAAETTMLRGESGALAGLPECDDLLEYDSSEQLRTAGSKRLEAQAGEIRAKLAQDNSFVLAAYLGDVLNDMRTGIHNYSRLSAKLDKYVSPWVFQQAFAYGHGQQRLHTFYDGREQQCASDYLNMLLERLNKERPLISETFTASFERYSECEGCSYQGSKTPEEQTSLDIFVTHKRGTKTLDELIEQSLSSRLDGHECSKCKEIGTTVRHTTLTHLPRQLFINIRRLNNGVDKNTASVDVQPEEEVLVAETRYRLRGMIRHKGNADGGHYTAFREMDREWYHIDDKYVSEVSVKKMKDHRRDGQSAMVMLEKVEE